MTCYSICMVRVLSACVFFICLFFVERELVRE
jgi:hypothetical protein